MKFRKIEFDINIEFDIVKKSIVCENVKLRKNDWHENFVARKLLERKNQGQV